MAKLDDKQVAIARVYSRSLLELAAAGNEADALLEELDDLVALLDRDADFAAFVGSPLIDVKDRTASLERLFRGKASDLLVDALQVLNRKGRLGLLPAIAHTYRRAHQERLGRFDVQVRTAVPLSDKARAGLAAVLAATSGRTPQLIEAVDPLLIGGMVLAIGDRKIDASVAREIQVLHGRLEERAANEIYRLRREEAGPTD